jgi:hypothetical protein
VLHVVSNVSLEGCRPNHSIPGSVVVGTRVRVGRRADERIGRRADMPIGRRADERIGRRADVPIGRRADGRRGKP